MKINNRIVLHILIGTLIYSLILMWPMYEAIRGGFREVSAVVKFYGVESRIVYSFYINRDYGDHAHSDFVDREVYLIPFMSIAAGRRD